MYIFFEQITRNLSKKFEIEKTNKLLFQKSIQIYLKLSQALINYKLKSISSVNSKTIAGQNIERTQTETFEFIQMRVVYSNSEITIQIQES
jgi:hypothetical protein